MGSDVTMDNTSGNNAGVLQIFSSLELIRNNCGKIALYKYERSK